MAIFSAQPLPLLSREEVELATGNPTATPEDLVAACRDFHDKLAKNYEVQLRHRLQHLPLPLTHCSVCGRSAGLKAAMFAALAYEKTYGVAQRLDRINGAVFSALLGHRQPLCCDAVWSCLELLEVYARHDKRHPVTEAPWNPGCCSDYAYMGTSLRLLPGAQLDVVTEAWQRSRGDCRPQQEMDAALRSLVGCTFKSNRMMLPQKALGALVVATCEVLDYSRPYNVQGEERVCIFGALRLSFLDDAFEEVEEVCLPSRHSLLAIAPHCSKGQYPRVAGTMCFVQRRFEERPNEIHVIRVSSSDLECSLITQDQQGQRRRVLLLLRTKSGAQLLVRARRRKGQDQVTEEVPLMRWVCCIAQLLDDARTQEELEHDLQERVRGFLDLDFGPAAPSGAWFSTLFTEMCAAEPGGDDDEAVSPASRIFYHAAQTAEAFLDNVAKMLASLLAVHLGYREADTLDATKSMLSASDDWKSLLAGAIREAMRQAIRSCRGSLSSKKHRPAPSCQSFDVSFALPDASRLATLPSESMSTLAGIDQFYKFHCEAMPPKAFIVLHEKEAWFRNQLTCPWCSLASTPADQPTDGIESWQCSRCGFIVKGDIEDRELLGVTLKKKLLTPPSMCAACHACQPLSSSSDEWTCVQCNEALLSPEDTHLERLGFALAVGERLATDRVALKVLRAALRGHDPLAKQKQQKRACEVVTRSIEGSARGTTGRRKQTLPPKVHQNIIDCRAGKDSNPDTRVFPLLGCTMQVRPTEEELKVILEHMESHLRTLAIAEEAWCPGMGRVEANLHTLCFFRPEDTREVLLLIRRGIHAAAWERRKPELATCCPRLHYRGAAPVVSMCFSGRDLVRAVLWRPLTYGEGQCLDTYLATGGPGCRQLAADQGLHESWAALETDREGLSFGWWVYPEVVTYCVECEHMVLREIPSFRQREDDAAYQLDGLCFYRISPELETSMRTLQTIDAATRLGFHSVRVGMTSTAAITAHAPERLSDELGVASTSSVRSIGFGPCKSNIRNLIGTAPCDNAYTTALDWTAFMHSYGTITQEDSMPRSEGACNHDVFESFSLEFDLPPHWTQIVCQDYRAALRNLIVTKADRDWCPEIEARLDPKTGRVDATSWTWVSSGQALCFLPPCKVDGKEKSMFLRQAPHDLWVKSSKAGGVLGMTYDMMV